MDKLQDITVGDRWPFKYFRIWKRTIDVDGKTVVEEEDLATNFPTLKISIRHEDNRDDLDDHTKDDIYADVVKDTSGLCHWEPGVGSTDKLGLYIGRLTGIRTGGEVWHSNHWFQFRIIHKSRHGRTPI